MKDFMPERDRFVDAIADNTWHSTNQDVERFISSDTEAKMRSFLQSAPDMFEAGDKMAPQKEADMSSTLSARAMLQLALLARETAMDDKAALSKSVLEGFGLVTQEPSQDLKDFLYDRAKMIEEAAQYLSEDGNDKTFAEREMGYTGMLNSNADIVGLSFDVVIPKGGYASFLLRMIEMNRIATEARGTASRWSAEWCVFKEENDGIIILEQASEKKADGLHLICAMGYCDDSDTGIKQALSNLCDLLMTLHMSDMRTIVVDGQEIRSIATGIGSLWWSALDAMRIGRLGACEVCGKPFITNNERGKKRKYCSEACKQWRKVHPGETRVNKDKPSPPEWARVDR